MTLHAWNHIPTVFQIQKCIIARQSRWVVRVASVLPGLGRVSPPLNYWQSNGLHLILHKKMPYLKENVHVQFAIQPKMSGCRPGRFNKWEWQKNTLYLFQTGRARCGREMFHNWSMDQIQVATEWLNSEFWIRAVVNMPFLSLLKQTQDHGGLTDPRCSSLFTWYELSFIVKD